MNDVNTNNIACFTRLSLYMNTGMLQVQQMRMRNQGPVTFSKIKTKKNNTNAVYISLMLKCEPAVT